MRSDGGSIPSQAGEVRTDRLYQPDLTALGRSYATPIAPARRRELSVALAGRAHQWTNHRQLHARAGRDSTHARKIRRIAKPTAGPPMENNFFNRCALDQRPGCTLSVDN